MCARDLNDLDPELRRRWHLACQEYRRLHGEDPFPFVTDMYRDAGEQQAKVNECKSDAPPGHSLHNYRPCWALDYGFRYAGSSKLSYADALFARMFAILPKYGLACGVWIHGGTASLWHDKGHTQPEGYTWQQASAGVPPRWAELPKGS